MRGDANQYYSHGSRDITEAKPRDHTRVSSRRPRREGWAPLGN
jgi:hypothetical protein